MEKVLHIDAGVTIDEGELTPEGWLRANALLTRAGIFKYQKADGTMHSELRLPEEVFAKEAMDSFSMVPMTDGHPPEPLTNENTKLYQVGQLGENIVKDGDFVRAKALFTDSKVIRKIQAGDKVQLSCGYTADCELSSGMYKGERYDSIQRNIRGNHVALVYQARGGPELRVRFDSMLAVFPKAVVESTYSTFEPSPGVTALKTFNIDGVDFEMSDSAIQALEKFTAAQKSALETSKSEATKQTARADGLDVELKQAQANLLIATDPVKLQEKVSARVSLETQAAKVLKDIALMTMSDLDIKVATVEKLQGKPLNRKDAEYVDAAYDFAMNSTGVIAMAGKEVAANQIVTDDGRLDSKKARDAYVKRMSEYVPVGELKAKS